MCVCVIDSIVGKYLIYVFVYVNTLVCFDPVGCGIEYWLFLLVMFQRLFWPEGSYKTVV